MGDFNVNDLKFSRSFGYLEPRRILKGGSWFGSDLERFEDAYNYLTTFVSCFHPGIDTDVSFRGGQRGIWRRM